MMIFGGILATVGGYLAKDGWEDWKLRSTATLSQSAEESPYAGLPTLANAPLDPRTVSEIQYVGLGASNVPYERLENQTDLQRKSEDGDSYEKFLAEAGLVGKKYHWIVQVENVEQPINIGHETFIVVINRDAIDNVGRQMFFNAMTSQQQLESIKVGDMLSVEGILNNKAQLVRCRLVETSKDRWFNYAALDDAELDNRTVEQLISEASKREKEKQISPSKMSKTGQAGLSEIEKELVAEIVGKRFTWTVNVIRLGRSTGGDISDTSIQIGARSRIGANIYIKSKNLEGHEIYRGTQMVVTGVMNENGDLVHGKITDELLAPEK